MGKNENETYLTKEEAVYIPARMVAIICGEDVNNVSTVEI